MANGIIHFRQSTLMTCYLTLGSSIFYPDFTTPILLGGIFASYFGPDCDIPGVNYTEKAFDDLIYTIIPLKCMKYKGKKVMMLLTLPYARFIPHRHWLSHLPILSSLIRLIVFGWWLIWLLYLYFAIEYVIVCIAMVCLVDLLHICSDGGMIIWNGRRKYIFGKGFYKLTRDIF